MAVVSTGRRNTPSHSICWGLNPRSCAHCQRCQSPRFLCCSEASKKPRRFVTQSVFPLQDRECCVDRLNRPPKADMGVDAPIQILKRTGKAAACSHARLILFLSPGTARRTRSVTLSTIATAS